MNTDKNVIFSFFEIDGYHLTDTQKQICNEFLMGNISKDEYLNIIMNDNMSLMCGCVQSAS